MTTAERDALVSRIQNLLNKTVENGATEAEAATAMAAAQRLMDQHNVALAEVVAHDAEAVSFNNEVIREGKSLDGIYEAALDVVDEAFAVRSMIFKFGMDPVPEFGLRRKTLKVQILLIGDPTNLEAAKWAVRFLAGTFRRLWEAYRERTGERDRYAYQGYVFGLRQGLLARLREERTAREREGAGSTNALVPLNTRLDQALEALAAGFEKGGPSRRSLDPAAYSEGRREGRNINLKRPVEGSHASAPGIASRN